MTRKRSKLCLVTLSIGVLLALFTGCGTGSIESEKQPEAIGLQKPIAEIEMQDGSTMVFELYPQFAPHTVENFMALAQAGFYDGLTFHRIIEDFMIQGGDPKGDGTGSSGKRIAGEFSKNGYTQNTLKHTKGVLSMARSNDFNSASCQFFVVHGEASFLDGNYAGFGQLIEGETVLDKIAKTSVQKNPRSEEVSEPKTAVLIKTIRIRDAVASN